MNSLSLKTPGVYINEIDAFGNSVVPVATAVPAFIGYTPQASYEGKSYYNKAFKISSFAEFQAIYMKPDPAPPADPARQYNPEYYLVPQKKVPARGDYLTISDTIYSILPDPATIYYLYNSVRLFYQNGGGDCYIVAVGGYGQPGKMSLATPGDQIVNPNITLNDLQNGLSLLQNEAEPTMYICPEATLLSQDNNETLMEAMLAQANEMQTTVCLFDLIGGNDPDPILYTQDIDNFRNATGTNGLKYGVAYYPFVITTIMQQGDIDFTNLFGGDTKQLAAIINAPDIATPAVEKILANITSPPAKSMTNGQLNMALLNASPQYAAICKHVLNQANTLPPSGGMAGVYTTNDLTAGVWQSPANVSITGVVNLPINLSDKEQENLNVDAVTGKSINAIRQFNGQGILVWGARTLDGNSQDWRYVSVRRTVTFLEQSCKAAARSYVFEPNNANTWVAVSSNIGSFLTSVWKDGGLQGATAKEAFSVSVGLGSTMTSEDILNGIMRVSVNVAIVHPAEFIEITFEQEAATSG